MNKIILAAYVYLISRIKELHALEVRDNKPLFYANEIMLMRRTADYCIMRSKRT